MFELHCALSMHEHGIDFLPSLAHCLAFIICREVHNRICIAGGDPALVESPTEPKWSAKGMCYECND
jgi:hypothetical protein